MNHEGIGMTESSAIPPFPAAIGVTHLLVYDTLAPDGLVGGSPHVHFLCSEMYVVIGGHGAVQTLSSAGFCETPLEPGQIVWFTPGVIHRLINHGKLEILVVMQNAGLPEAGDFVLTFPESILSDEQAYADAASLSPRGHVYASGERAAYRRRDLAVQGFVELQQRFQDEGSSALDRFYRQALQIIQPKLDAWHAVWERGPLAVTQQTGQHLSDLAKGDSSFLRQGSVYTLPAPASPRRLGMCGTLGVYLPEGAQKVER